MHEPHLQCITVLKFILQYAFHGCVVDFLSKLYLNVHVHTEAHVDKKFFQLFSSKKSLLGSNSASHLQECIK